MYFLGIDLGSSSIKLSVFEADKQKEICAITVPEFETKIDSPKMGWGEQNPNLWWEYIKDGIQQLKKKHGVVTENIKGIGIAYQMHGLVLVDSNLEPVRPAIIWCDGRAAEIGRQYYQLIGEEVCQSQILGSPGNFTASKLKWVQENQPEVFSKASYMMLPGDFIAAKLTGVAQTSTSGLSEAALWNFKENRPAIEILQAMGISDEVIPEVVETFGHHAKVDVTIAKQLGINNKAMVTYRAGDQPNNAMSLSALKPGEVVANAGTSAVVYAVTNTNAYDKNNKVNTFLHVNNSIEEKRNGVLLCVNGSGILYQWLRKLLSVGKKEMVSYELLNSMASQAKVGSKGLRFYPFGNGVERIFNNKEVNSGIENLNFNIHQPEDLVRAACEGIVFAMNYGFDVIKSIGVSGDIVKASHANLFLSPVFRSIFANTSQTALELYKTSGAEGAARGAAYGWGYFNTLEEAFSNLNIIEHIEPDLKLSKQYQDIYQNWKKHIKIQDNNYEYDNITSLL
ncbi:xylulokinase [Mangrovimonas cancribranchiae]|uniref:FGGY family carbohydrate kinase n=1 Tax=Mangrovimonas cancribranchiae TaxID=3080055 RepID=A0AAU6P5D0_9FLAO